MSNENQQAGFNKSRTPQDRRGVELNEKYGLPADASLEQIEIVAQTLLLIH